MVVRERQIKLRKSCGKLRCHNQTPRSLKEQHLGTGDTQGTHTHARGTSQKELRENRGTIAGNCEIAKRLRASAPPPPRDAPCKPIFATIRAATDTRTTWPRNREAP